ncbi:MAG: 2'-5' RNA ligase [Gemmatimonadetes bacterium GWC2_71_9]|nr:MAG: 2'-5' RNA ligase [Gemmatimonadetes bacterium GWC2_71_9]
MRLFVAVNLPAQTRHAAWEAAAPLRAAGLPVRWVADEAIHITLKFLGEVDEPLVPDIAAVLSTAVREVRAFELGLGGCGAFPDQHRPRVLWLGIEQHPALELLANDVERALAPFGFESELRPFQPHLTLGRAEKRARPGDFRGLDKLVARVEFAAVMPVASVDLMQSVLGRGGPTYTVLHRAVLQRSAPPGDH